MYKIQEITSKTEYFDISAYLQLFIHSNRTERSSSGKHCTEKSLTAKYLRTSAPLKCFLKYDFEIFQNLPEP